MYNKCTPLWLPYKNYNTTFYEAINNRNRSKSLGELMNQVVQMVDQHYYLLKLLGYDYIISHRSGKSNTVADALSRQDYTDSAMFFIVSTPYFDFLMTLLSENNSSPELQALHQELIRKTISIQSSKIINGILYYKGKPFLGKNSTLKTPFLFLFFFSRNSMQHLLEVTLGWVASMETYFGMACTKMFKILFLYATYFNTRNIYQRLH